MTGGRGVHVFLVLWKALRAVEAYAEKSISLWRSCATDFAVLEALLHKGPLPVNEIGRKVLLTSGSITTAVDRLESKGLVERRAHGSDRRATHRAPDEAGQNPNHARLRPTRCRPGAPASASLTKEERTTLIRLLKKLVTKRRRRRNTSLPPERQARSYLMEATKLKKEEQRT